MDINDISNQIKDNTNFTMTDMYDILISCALLWVVFTLFESKLDTTKRKSWIIMMFSSIILSFFGTISFIYTESNSLWTESYVYNENWLQRKILLFFLSTNIMDLIIGYNFYYEQLDILSSVIHHIFYISFIIILLNYHYSSGFVLCFFMEIPTTVLAIGTVFPTFRSNILFGVSFFITRIVYNIYLAYKLAVISFSGVIWKVCVLVLMLHMFWFYKWAIVYGKSLFSKQESCISN